MKQFIGFGNIINENSLAFLAFSQLILYVLDDITDNNIPPDTERPTPRPPPPLLHHSDVERPEIPRPQRPQTAQGINSQGKLSIT